MKRRHSWLKERSLVTIGSADRRGNTPSYRLTGRAFLNWGKLSEHFPGGRSGQTCGAGFPHVFIIIGYKPTLMHNSPLMALMT